MTIRPLVRFVGVAAVIAACAPAQDAAPPAASEDEGVVPLRDYGGDVWSRRYLLGDLGDARSRWAEAGVQFRVDWTHSLQSIADGGLDRATKYGATADLFLEFDLHRMGLLPGATLTARVESRYGESVNGRTGQILPANTDLLAPLTSEIDEDVVALTNLFYTQFLSDSFGVLVGKLDNFESDFNEFASGRGQTQFQNANLVFSPATLLEPYATLGVVGIWVPNERSLVWGGLLNTVDSSTTSGFSDIGDGTSAFVETYLQHSISGWEPGGGSVGVLYEFDNEFQRLDRSRLTFGPTGAVFTPQTDDDAWVVYGSAWQYLWTEEDAADTVVNVQDHEIDLQGVGVFLRGGGADTDVNPVEWFLSGGISGRGVIDGRDDDTFGLGYFYNSIQPTRILGALGLDDASQGFEAYYRFAVTPATFLTVDLQALESIRPGVDTALLLGLRLHTRF